MQQWFGSIWIGAPICWKTWRIKEIESSFYHHRMSTIKHPPSIIFLGVVASNGKKKTPGWFERSYGLTSSLYKKVLETKVLPWVKMIIKKADYAFQHNEAPALTANTVQDWLNANMIFWSYDLRSPQSPYITPSSSACERTLRIRLARHATAAQMSSRLLWTAYGGRWGKASSIMSARSSNIDLNVLLPLKVATLNNLMLLFVNISLWYKCRLISFQTMSL